MDKFLDENHAAFQDEYAIKAQEKLKKNKGLVLIPDPDHAKRILDYTALMAKSLNELNREMIKMNSHLKQISIELRRKK